MLQQRWAFKPLALCTHILIQMNVFGRFLQDMNPLKCPICSIRGQTLSAFSVVLGEIRFLQVF